MGYTADLINTDFTIEKDKVQPAHAALIAWAQDAEHIAYADPAEVVASTDFQEAMESMDWGVEIDGNGNVIDVSWPLGGDNKVGSTDDELFGILAPFVKAGSTMDFLGEDYCAWRYEFDGKTMTMIDGRVVFNKREDAPRA